MGLGIPRGVRVVWTTASRVHPRKSYPLDQTRLIVMNNCYNNNRTTREQRNKTTIEQQTRNNKKQWARLGQNSPHYFKQTLNTIANFESNYNCFVLFLTLTPG